MSKARLNRFVEVMTRHGQHPIELSMDVTTIVVLISALQLALRHPDFDGQNAKTSRRFVEVSIRRLEQIHPLLGEVMRLGNDPAHDVPRDSEWCEACRSFHVPPQDRAHHTALRCVAPWEGRPS